MNSIFDTLMKDASRSFIGFDSMFRDMLDTHKKIVPNFPPYNIKKIDEKNYTIELAVAGFGKQDLEIRLDDDRLTITGKSSNKEDSCTYLYNGLAQRAFSRTFFVNDIFEVRGAKLVNGVLKVALERLADTKSSKVIEIEDEASTVSEFAQDNPQLLTEEDVGATNGTLM